MERFYKNVQFISSNVIKQSQLNKQLISFFNRMCKLCFLNPYNYNKFTISITVYLYNSLLKCSENFNYIIISQKSYIFINLSFFVFSYYIIIKNMKISNFHLYKITIIII